MTRVIQVLGTVGTMALLGCGASNPVTPAVADRATVIAKLTGNAQSGKTVYESTSAPACVGCHKADGNGSPPGIPGLAEPSRNDPAEELVGYIVKGKGKMPSQAQLTDQQIADVIAYMKTTFGK